MNQDKQNKKLSMYTNNSKTTDEKEMGLIENYNMNRDSKINEQYKLEIENEIKSIKKSLIKSKENL